MSARKPDILVIVSDSLRQDHVSYYTGTDGPVPTPAIDALLADSVTLDRMTPQGLPTIPARTEWMTGMGTLAGRSWQPLADTDVTLAEVLQREGFVTALISDMYHYFKPGQTFHRGYHEWQWVRGQEYDSCSTAPATRRRVEDHWKDSFPPNWRHLIQVVCQNLDDCSQVTDFPCYKTFDRAATWVERNRGQKRPILLWVETFDPHEPWTPPARFDRFGDPAYSGKDYILPPGGPAANHFSAEEIRRIRALYGGEVAYVDWLVGEFIKTLKGAGRYDDSLIVFLSDHGHPLAEHGKFLKGSDRMHSELLRVPFAFKLPGQAHGGLRLGQLAQFPDVLPTLLDAAGMGNNLDVVQGRSLMPVVRGEVAAIRRATISGYHSGGDRCIRDETWSLVLRPGDQPDELYNLETDPLERRSVIAEHAEEAERLRAKFGAAFAVPERPIKGLQGAFEVADTPAAVR